MSEMAITADRLIIIGRGWLITETSVDDLLARAQGTVRIRGPQINELTDALIGHGAAVEAAGPDTLLVTGLIAGTVGEVAARCGVALTELVDQRPTLEDIYMELTSDASDYHSTPLQDRP